jgi:hypothetical protein
MKKSLVLKNKKRINRDMKDTTIATWFWRSRRGKRSCHAAKRRKFRRCNFGKAMHLDILIALKNFERKNT